MASVEIIQKPSVCPLDCADTCSLTAYVEAGKLIKVRGSTNNPFTRGIICEKVNKYFPDFVHGDRRLTQPLKRSGPRGSGKYEPISWDEAIELCYQGMKNAIDQYGSETVLPFNYAGPHGQLAGGSMDRRFFYKLGATQLNRATLCAGVRSLAYSSMFGTAVAMPQEQAEHSDLIIIWGSNTSSTNLHLMKIINAARKKGAKVIVIDP
ncbi:MAG: molybdopterin-dependent oxidoreductase, partial [Gammaproteobacteria bacterium]|nr:molybdopterin-dependent oxidoreductase [Gammaproteobacteria bacterium]